VESERIIKAKAGTHAEQAAPESGFRGSVKNSFRCERADRPRTRASTPCEVMRELLALAEVLVVLLEQRSVAGRELPGSSAWAWDASFSFSCPQIVEASHRETP